VLVEGEGGSSVRSIVSSVWERGEGPASGAKGFPESLSELAIAVILMKTEFNESNSLDNQVASGFNVLVLILLQKITS
jgi:hypothetical protein